MFLSIIIPAYNEEKRIGATLSSVGDYLEKNFSGRYEVLVVDDGSRDSTSKKVAEFSIMYPKFFLHRYERNRGKGYAVGYGMSRAVGEVKIFMDADGSTQISELPHLIKKIEEGNDAVVTSRRMAGAEVLAHQNKFRDFLGGIFRSLVALLIPLGVSDSQNGFKAFTKNAAQIIFPHQKIYDFAFDVELLAIAKKSGLRIAEVPVRWRDDRRSTVTFLGMVRMFFSLIRIRWNLWSGVYGR